MFELVYLPFLDDLAGLATAEAGLPPVDPAQVGLLPCAGWIVAPFRVLPLEVILP